MRIEKRDNGIYTKALSEMEAYLLNIIKRFFEKTNIELWESREAIIIETIRRAKEEIALESGVITSVNGQVGEVVLDAYDVNAEPIINKNTAFNKNFGDTSNTVCEGNDPRLSREDLYNKEEIDKIVDNIKKLSAGIKFNIHKSEWVSDGEIYTAILNHNLNLNLECLNIKFYKDNESLNLDYKVRSNNSILIYSDEVSDITIAIRQAIVSNVAIPTDIREQIDSNTTNLEIYRDTINNNSLDITRIGNFLEEFKINSDENLKTVLEMIKVNTANIETKSNINHTHTIENISDLNIDDIFKKDFGNISDVKDFTVQIKKGTKQDIRLYKGPIGEIIYDKTNKTLVLQDGETFGGVGISNENHRHSYLDISDIPEVDFSKFYTKLETYNKSEVDNLFSSIEIIDSYTKNETNIKLKEIDDLTFIKPPVEEEGYEGNIAYKINHIKNNLKDLDRNAPHFLTFNIIESDWVLDAASNIYTYNLNHNENLPIDALNLEFYIENSKFIFDYEFIDKNNIKIYSKMQTPLKIIVRTIFGIRVDIVSDEFSETGGLL